MEKMESLGWCRPPETHHVLTIAGGVNLSIHVFDVGELSIDFNAAEVYNSWEDYMREVLDDDEGVISHVAPILPTDVEQRIGDLTE